MPSTDPIDSQETNPRMCMKVQGRLMQARFIEIHQDFAKKKPDTFLTGKYTADIPDEDINLLYQEAL